MEIVDHRKDEGKYPWVCGDNRVISFDPLIGVSSGLVWHVGLGVGSCCTLIAEKLRANPTRESLPVLATLLEGVILLDTLNLSPTANKTTPRDVQIVSWLQSLIPQNRGNAGLVFFFRRIIHPSL